MLILCNGMIRSGSTLQYNLTRALLERLGLGRGEGWLASDVLENAQSRLDRWAAASRWHVLKTHRLPSYITELIDRHAARVCYVHRDLRDVAVSAKRKWGYRDETLYGALTEAVENYYAVERLGPVLQQRYDEVVRDLPQAVVEISEFLSLQVSPPTVVAIAAEQSLEQARARSAALANSAWFRARAALFHTGRKLGLGRLAQTLAARGLPVGRVRALLGTWDRRTLEHANHISCSGGASGEWQRELTADERKTITGRFGAWLELAGYRTTEWQGAGS